MFEVWESVPWDPSPIGMGNMPMHQDMGRTLAWLGSHRVIIYGAGKIGERVHRCLCRLGIPTWFFWDVKAETIQELCGVPVRKPDFHELASSQRADAIILVTVFSENVRMMIRDKLRAAGYHHTMIDLEWIDALLYWDCQRQVEEGRFAFDLKTCHLCPVGKRAPAGCAIRDGYIRRRWVTGLSSDLGTSRLVIASMGLLVSNRCTLTCKGCNHLRDHYKASDNIDIPAEQLIEDLGRVVDAVDLIDTLVVVGGEPFVHRDIGAILERILELPKIGVIHIITNGTALPDRDRTFPVLANPRIFVEISGYGHNIPGHLRKNVKHFVSELEAHGVNHRITSSMQWFDFGGFEQRAYSRTDQLRVYNTCCFKSNDLFDGKLFKCSRSAFTTFLRKIPDFAEDYIDVRGLPKERLRRSLQGFLQKQIFNACRYCNGTSTATIPAGLQVERRART